MTTSTHHETTIHDDGWETRSAGAAHGCWLVRIITPAAVLQVMTRTEPRVTLDAAGRVAHAALDIIAGTPGSDVLGFIDWAKVDAVCWRPAFDPLASDLPSDPAAIAAAERDEAEMTRAFELARQRPSHRPVRRRSQRPRG